MSSKGKPLFDLNEPATEEDEESDGVFSFQPQRAVPSTTHTSDLFKPTNSPRRIINNHAFSHASSVSGFQPFIRSKVAQPSEIEDQKRPIDDGSAIEKEEGEWSDAEGSSLPDKSASALDDKSTSALDDKSKVKPIEVLPPPSQWDSDIATAVNTSSNVDDVKDENSNHGSLGLDGDSTDRKSSDSQEDSMVAPKQREIKGVEATHALKIANNPGKRPKFDQQKEAMLGKKRSRQTMFLNLEDVKQAGAIKTSTPKRQLPPVTTRIVKDKQIQPPLSKDESSSIVESNDVKSECNNGDMNSGILGRPKRSISGTDLATEDKLLSNQRQSISKQTKNAQVPGRKTLLISQNTIDPKAGGKKLPSKKPLTVTTQYQDTSVERLLREVTNDKFWQHPGLKRSIRCTLNSDSINCETLLCHTHTLLSFCCYYCVL